MESIAALVVDDDESARLVLASMLESAGFDTLMASSGEEALSVIDQTGVTLVLCDWQMPGMSGTDLCEQLRLENSDRYVYFILVTGSQNTESILAALETGVDDFMKKPVAVTDLKLRLKSATRIIDIQEKLAARNDFLEYAYQSVTTDLKIAAKVQEDLLPRQFRLAGMDANWVFKPANFVAGDMFDYFPMGPDHFVFYILDVEGHGIASALTSFAVNNQLNPSVHGLCANAVRRHSEMGDVVMDTVSNLNRQFSTNLNSSRYFTMIYGIIEISTGKVTLTQAGHPPAILLKKSTGEAIPLGEGGMPVGMLDDAVFGFVTSELSAGDRLFIYSDGMLECENTEGEFYGSARLLDCIQEWKDRPIEDLNVLFDNEIEKWNGSERYDDDVSMVIFEYTGKR